MVRFNEPFFLKNKRYQVNALLLINTAACVNIINNYTIAVTFLKDEYQPLYMVKSHNQFNSKIKIEKPQKSFEQLITPQMHEFINKTNTRNFVLVSLSPDGFRLRFYAHFTVKDNTSAVEHAQ